MLAETGSLRSAVPHGKQALFVTIIGRKCVAFGQHLPTRACERGLAIIELSQAAPNFNGSFDQPVQDTADIRGLSRERGRDFQRQQLG